MYPVKGVDVDAQHELHQLKRHAHEIGILPLSLDQELHVILPFAKNLNGKGDLNWRNYVNITDTGTTRNEITRNFCYTAFRLRKWYSDLNKSLPMVEHCSNFLKMDILFDHQYKDKLLFQIYFKLKLNERLVHLASALLIY